MLGSGNWEVMYMNTNEKNERWGWKASSKGMTHIVPITSLCTKGSDLGLYSLQIRKPLRRHLISQWYSND